MYHGDLQYSKIGHVLYSNSLLDFEEEVREAKCTTKFLEAEKIKVTEKPQTDAEYLR